MNTMPNIERKPQFEFKMKTKVKKTMSHQSIQWNKNNFNLCFSVNYIFCMIYLLGIINMSVDAYVSDAIKLTPSNIREFSSQHLNKSKLSMGRNRSGRFLFDAFFDINTPQFDAVDDDDFDDDDDDLEETKPCKCGNVSFSIIP